MEFFKGGMRTILAVSNHIKFMQDTINNLRDGLINLGCKDMTVEQIKLTNDYAAIVILEKLEIVRRNLADFLDTDVIDVKKTIYKL